MLIAVSAYAEILVAPDRRGPEAVGEVEAFFADFAIRIEPVIPPTARAAASLRSASRRLRLPDALVFASAEERGADSVLTADESWARISGRVTLSSDAHNLPPV